MGRGTTATWITGSNPSCPPPFLTRYKYVLSTSTSNYGAYRFWHETDLKLLFTASFGTLGLIGPLRTEPSQKKTMWNEPHTSANLLKYFKTFEVIWHGLIGLNDSWSQLDFNLILLCHTWKQKKRNLSMIDNFSSHHTTQSDAECAQHPQALLKMQKLYK